MLRTTRTRPGRLLAALVAIGATLSACGDGEPDAEPEATEEATEDAGSDSEEPEETEDDGAAEADEEVTLSFAHSYGTEHPHHRCGVQAVADKVAEADVGLTIEVFPNSQLGGDADRFTSVMSGDIDVDLQGSSALSATYEPIGLLDVAYAFDGADHIFSFFDSEDSAELRGNFEAETGTKILDIWFFGMRHFTANSPIRTPEDLQGLRMRFPDSPTYLANAEALGADATPVAFEEVYLSLQQGVIDGQENPIPTIAQMNFVEVQDYISLSGHQAGAQLSVIGDAAWERLSTGQQETLEAVFDEVRLENRECIDQAEADLLAEWEETGAIEIVDDVDVEAFRTRAEDYFRERFDGFTLETYETIRASAP